MAEGGNKQTPFLPITGILALITVVGVAIFTQEPLKGIRPAIEKAPGTTERIDARLWQDPFRAVLDHLKTDNSAFCTATSSIRKEDLTPKTFTVLAVMVSGAPYAEESENRIRKRYAVLSALRRLTYYPDDSEHIRFLKYPNKRGGITKPHMGNIVPYETLRSKRYHDNPILLLWISESALDGADKPLAGLTDYLAKVTSAQEEPLTIIGPSSSTGLTKMLGEITGAGYSAPVHRVSIYSPSATIDEIFLLYPTEIKALPFSDVYNSASPEAPKTDEYKNINIRRTIGTDFDLSQKTVAELRIRHCLGKGSHIAIISEWDTDYGRHIYDTFRNSLYAELSDFSSDEFPDKNSVATLHSRLSSDLIGYPFRDKISSALNNHTIGGLNAMLRTTDLYDHLKKTVKTSHLSWPVKLMARKTEKYRGLPIESLRDKQQQKILRGLNRMLVENLYDAPRVDRRIHRFSYMRGIDGTVPGEEQRKDSKTDGKDGKELKGIMPSAMPEEASGKSQYDYLRRLADKIYEEDRQLRLNGEKGITAIGVLGSDFYDKYLVLQALRQRMPEAVFFTTDLDARYLKKENSNFTKNLLVASHFGFELQGKNGEDLQGDVPPFRDSYQTAIFYATLKALENEAIDNLKIAAVDTTPHMYEIGRQHAVDLTYYNFRTKSFLQFHWGKILLFFAVGLWLLAFSMFRIQSFFRHVYRSLLARGRDCIGRWKIALPSCLFVLAAIAGLSYFAGNRVFPNLAQEEPFSLFEGVSVWPTEILRLLAMCLSLLFIFLIYVKLRKNQDKITGDFGFAPYLTGPSPDALGTFCRPLQNLSFVRRLHSHNLGAFKGRYAGESKVSLCMLWPDYLNMGDCRSRAVRVLIDCVLFISLGVIIMSIFGFPGAPLRGTYTAYVDKGVLLFSVGAFLFLTFLTVDATRLCSYFVSALTSVRPDWPVESASRYMTEPMREDRRNVYEEWMLLDLVGRHTEVVQRFIFYPIIVLIILAFSRNSYFDNWETPLSLLTVIALSAVFAWSCVFRLRKATEGLRRSVKERLGMELDRELFKEKSCQVEGKADLIKHVAKEAEDMKTGAFAPLSEHPLVYSALTGIGGIGGASLLQFLNVFNM